MLCRILRGFAFLRPRNLAQAEAKASPPEPHAEPDPTSTPSEAEGQDVPLPPAATPPSQPDPVAAAPTQAREIEVVIGIDLGTSCTKIAARLPYEAGQPTYALPVPLDRRAEGHPHLWRSELWLAPGGAFSLHPLPGGNRLTQLKWDLMQSPDLSAASGPRPSPIEAASAFLALQIRQARSWVAQNRHKFARPEDNLRWFWHVGFPAASLDDTERRVRYEICLAAALGLASSSGPLLLAGVREAMERISGNPGAILQKAGAALFPEVAAAVAEFALSSRHENGLYAMIDVGAGTVDCCTFNLVHRQDGTMACPIFVADVALLGMEPWRACRDDPEAEAAFRHNLDLCARGVILQTRTCRYRSSHRWAEGLPLFLIGGGAASDPHSQCAKKLTPLIRRHLGVDKYPNAGIPIVAPPVPALAEGRCNESQLRRLTVAAGLTLPADWIPRVELPLTIPDDPKPPRWAGPDPIGPEQT